MFTPMQAKASFTRWLRVVALALGCLVVQPSANAADQVGPVPEEFRSSFKLPVFYQKLVSVEGFPIVASEKVSDYALAEAAYLVRQMLSNRTDILQALAKNKVRFSIMAVDEFTTNVPEHSDLQPKAYWDKRARGLGATRARPSVSCGEENLLCYKGDPYSTENILIHEFGHAIHEMGLRTVDPTFDGRLKETYEAAMKAGLWKGKYAANNKQEYWAEGVQSWFDTNRENDHDHNHVNTRGELKEYDPALAKLVAEVFGDGEWRYQRPERRKSASHLTGYDPAKAPRFAWPAAMVKAYEELQSAKKEPGAGTVSLAPLAPNAREQWKSTNGGKATTVLFVNSTDSEVNFYWMDPSGARKNSGRLRPKETLTQSTYAGHIWLFTDAQDKPLAVFEAGEKAGRALIAPPAK